MLGVRAIISKHQIWPVIKTVAIVCCVIATGACATNPDYNFPGLLEFFIIAVSLAVIFDGLRLGRGLSRAELGVFGFFVALILLLIPRFVLSAKEAGTLKVLKACAEFPTVVSKLECGLTQPFSSAHGLRQILFHLTALVLCFATATLVREMTSVGLPWCKKLFLVPFALLALFSLPGIQSSWHISLFSQNLISSSWDHGRLPGVVANPSWLWPLLLPGFCFSLATFLESRGWQRLVGLILSAAAAIAVAYSNERGGYLTYSVVFGVAFGFRLTRALNAKKRIVLTLLTSLSVCFLVVVAYRYAKLVGIEVREDITSPSSERLRMWSEALRHFNFFGNGYGSWWHDFKVFSEKSPRLPVFDTAHNLIIQSVFELGFLHAAIVFFCLGSLIYYTVFFKNNDDPVVKRMSQLLLVGSAINICVQEIDYISTIYYQHAIFWGIAFGGVTRASRREPQKNEWGVPGLILAGAVLFGAVTFASGVSWGGSTFEPSAEPLALFRRWFRPRGVFVNNDSPVKDALAFYTLKSPVGIKPQDIFGSTLAAESSDGFFLKTPTFGGEARVSYGVEQGVQDPQRLIAFQLTLPPLFTNLIPLTSKNAFSLESDDDEGQRRLFRWCSATCSLIFYKPERRTALLRLRYPTWMEAGEGQKIKVSIRNRSENGKHIDLTKTSLDNSAMFSDATVKNVTLVTNRDGVAELKLEENFIGTYEVQLHSPLVSSPREKGVNNDGRLLSFQVFYE